MKEGKWLASAVGAVILGFSTDRSKSMLSLILLVFAFVLTTVEAFYPSWPRPQLGWLGLAVYFLSLLLGRAALGHAL
jgi:hypothetical protein